MTNQITENTTERANFMVTSNLDSMYRIAKAFNSANCFSGTVKSPEQALVILMAGNEAGLSPVESMNGFYFVKNSLNIYGSALSKVITRGGIKIKFLERSKTRVSIEYKQDGEVVDTMTYSLADLPKTSQASKFAPEEKLVYHCHSRFLRYHDIGASIPMADYDQEIIEAEEVQEDPKVKRIKALIEDAKDYTELIQYGDDVEEMKNESVTERYTEKLSKFMEIEEEKVIDVRTK